ncbi:MAG: hypothetical protein H8F28_14360 [Fibrella sp.]|nr:hypothetical protein [Armatimonadota bacterium]
MISVSPKWHHTTFYAVTALAMMPFISGCGGGNDGNDDLGTLPIPTPFPSSSVAPSPSPSVSPSPGTLPTPVPTPTPTPDGNLPPVSGETLTEGQGVLVFTEASADTNTPTDALSTNSGDFNLGAVVPPLGENGNSVQVYFSDVRNSQLRSVTVVLADRAGVREGVSLPLGGVVDRVMDKNAFVILSTKPASDASDTSLKQWHSAGGGTVTLQRLTDGTVKVRVENARMVPYTAARNNGQTGSFTLNGAGFAVIRAQ